MSTGLTENRSETPPVSPSSNRLPTKRLIAGGTLALVCVGGYAAGWSPLFGVNEVRVEGASMIPAETVRSTAAIAEGTPMMRLDTLAATARVSDLSQVESVQITRQWPRAVVITVRERGAQAVREVDGGWELVDDNGVAFAISKKRPKGLPALVDMPDAASETIAIDVLGVLPEEVYRQIGEVTVTSPEDIRFVLRRDGAVVSWGGVEDSEFKAKVLAVLLAEPAGWYDVSSPRTPSTADAEPVAATPTPTPSATPSDERSSATPSPSVTAQVVPDPAEGPAQPAASTADTG